MGRRGADILVDPEPLCRLCQRITPLFDIHIHYSYSPDILETEE